jgi:hypothetical protein
MAPKSKIAPSLTMASIVALIPATKVALPVVMLLAVALPVVALPVVVLPVVVLLARAKLALPDLALLRESPWYSYC